MKPLGPRTLTAYHSSLKRVGLTAEGSGFAGYVADERAVTRAIEAAVEWPKSSKLILRAALFRAYCEARKTEFGRERIQDIDLPFSVSKQIVIPARAEIDRFEKHAESLPAVTRAMVLVPLLTGLRAQEWLSLDRSSVEDAVKNARLTLVRKGGREKTIPVGPRIMTLLHNCLSASAKPAWKLEHAVRHTPWKKIGDLVSGGSSRTQYNVLLRMVKKVAAGAGIDPAMLGIHGLRHSFASRMLHGGADIKHVQQALGHASIDTTAKYLHVENKDLEKYFK